ncbi:hypothetical protein HHL11_11675 [Ramlibacter sp. G-1-2-2]|uniref:Uncharacterized protein n=1 Tax=Ramlibacter agri TaxID=2728837 RepID=A0A848H0U3_9BURK|nr:hypothetical protein [Ramlibacter agri]NML44415.1 hypothetical protein [Ramlibacter agri]
MKQSRRTGNGILHFLLAATTVALLACIAVVALVSLGAWPTSRVAEWALLAAITVLTVAVVTELEHLRVRRQGRDQLVDPLEVSTLSFPPGSLGRPSRLPAVRNGR